MIPRYEAAGFEILERSARTIAMAEYEDKLGQTAQRKSDTQVGLYTGACDRLAKLNP